MIPQALGKQKDKSAPALLIPELSLGWISGELFQFPSKASAADSHQFHWQLTQPWPYPSLTPAGTGPTRCNLTYYSQWLPSHQHLGFVLGWVFLWSSIVLFSSDNNPAEHRGGYKRQTMAEILLVNANATGAAAL